LQTLETDFTNTILSLDSLKLNILTWFEAALTSIAEPLGVHSHLPLTILLALSDAMERDSETINARELIINASDVEETSIIVPHSDNVGSGRLAYTLLRTGSDESEIANDEVLQCQCISSTTLKKENFQLSGAPIHSRESYLGQGSGLGPTLTALGNSITNGDFEDWTSSAADNWTATVGAWDTEIIQEASVLYEGVYAAKTAYAEADWKITHAVPITLLPDTIYIMVLAARKVTNATGTLRFGISNGDAVDAFVAGCVKSIDVEDLSTSYALQFLIFKTPAAVGSTWTLGISSDTPGTADFYFDLAQFGVMTSFNNINFAIIAGETGFGLNDKFGFGSDNTGFKVDVEEPGIVQEFIGRCFKMQLPSATSNNETIVDPGVPRLIISTLDRLTTTDDNSPSIPILMVNVSDSLTLDTSTIEYEPVYITHVTDDLTITDDLIQQQLLYEIHVTDNLTVASTVNISIPILQVFVTDGLTTESTTSQELPPFEVSVTDNLTVVTSTTEYEPVYVAPVVDNLTVVTATAETIV